MKRKQSTRKPAKPHPKAKSHRKAHVKPTTALARRPVAIVPRGRVDILPAESHANGETLTVLGEEATLGALGLVEVKLTEKEEAVLARPVELTQVLIKPTGQVYLSHTSYTRQFNEAFGRLGWAIVPRSKPMKTGNSVVCPYMLYVHGQPVAFAMGEQEYFEGNREQTYGDALEATVASALRRCAKRLGVSLELWDKAWGDRFMAEHGVKVRVVVKRDGSEKVKYQWRRKIDPPFYNEVGRSTQTPEGEHVEDGWRSAAAEPAQRRAAPPPPAQRPPVQAPPIARPATPVAHSGADAQPITEAQRRRLWTILKNSGRNETAFRTWLQTRYKIDSTKEIARGDYEAICASVEAEGALPL